MNASNSGNSAVYSLSKKVVEECLPEEKELFGSIWQIIKKEISERGESPAELLEAREYKAKLAKELQFLDEADVAGLQTPKVIALISLVWLRLAEFKGQVQDADIEETITKYGKSLPEGLILKTIRLAVPMIKEDLKNIGRFPVIEEEEEKKYVMYSHDKKKGKPLTEIQYSEQKEIDKSKLFIWLDEKNGEYLIKRNTPQKMFPEERRLLTCLIKNIGNNVSYRKLYEAMHNAAETDLEEWNRWEFERTNDVQQCKSALIKHCPEIKKFIVTVRWSGYRLFLPDNVKYCLIEELPEIIT